jgi:hypothetical protein
MQRLTAFVVVAVSALVLASIAAAGKPTVTTTPLNISTTLPAGTACDVAVKIELTGTHTATQFDSGRIQGQDRGEVTYTNLATNATLTGKFGVNGQAETNGERDTGLSLHLRDASGNLVVVAAGRITFDSSFQVVSFTPHSQGDAPFDLICPALGANPA